MNEPAAPPPAPMESWEVLDLLTALVQKSLVVYEEDEQGQGRYRLLETTRQYARDRLLERGEEAAVRERHRDWFLALAEQRSREESEAARLDRLEREHDNLRAALAWSEAQGEREAVLRLFGAQRGIWTTRGYWAEGREHLARLLALPGAEARTAERARALHGTAWLAHTLEDFGAARALWEESLAICREVEDKWGIAITLNNLGRMTAEQGDYDAARVPLEESLAVFREIGNQQGAAWSIKALGIAARDQGDYGTARTLFEQSLAIHRELGDRGDIAPMLNRLGSLALDQRNYGEARTLFEECLAIFREIGGRYGTAVSLRGLGSAALNQGDLGAARTLLGESLAIFRKMEHKGEIAANLERLAELAVAQAQPQRAARLLGAAEGLREASGAPLPPVDRAEHDRLVAAIRTALGEEVFAAAWAEGRSLALEDAIHYALGTEPS